LLPPAEPNERFYRLIAAVLADLRAAPESGIWRGVTYFSYWAVRLSGFLPDLRVSPQSQQIGAAIAATPIAGLAGLTWTKDTAADLRRFLVRQLEEHVERKLITVPVLEAL
jgi:DNA repair protein RecO (recombination protein O)